MSRLRKKFIRFGTGTDDTNSRVIPANFTPSNYTPTQIAAEGNDKVSAHLNGIDTVLGVVYNTGDLGDTSFSGANNQSSPVNVTGLVFSNATVRSFEAQVSVLVDATADFFESFTLKGIQRGSDWSMSTSSEGDDSQITFSITTAGQVQYTSANYAGFVALTMHFRAETLGV